MLAVTWLRPDADISPDRSFCHTFGRGHSSLPCSEAPEFTVAEPMPHLSRASRPDGEELNPVRALRYGPVSAEVAERSRHATTWWLIDGCSNGLVRGGFPRVSRFPL